MRIQRSYTRAGQDAYADLAFTTTASEIRNPDGTVVFRLDAVEVPERWSQVASDVIAQKYFRKAGVPARLRRVPEEGIPEFLWRSVPDEDALAALPVAERFGGETSAREVFDRLAGAWAYWGWKGGYFTSEEDARAYHDEMRAMLALQVAAPNSPQWFNTGLHWAYGIDGPAQGHFYVDHETGELTRSTSSYEHPQPHACFIQSCSDDLVNDGGIMDLWVREARLFKYGSGTGTNFSHLRGEGEALSGGGRSSGLMGFLRIGDRAAGAIKSGGTTRRAAKMVIVDADHPDIEAFVNWKVVEEQKVASLVAGSKMHEERLNAIFAAIRAWDGAEEGATDPAANVGLKSAIRAAKKAAIPETYVARVLQYAKQGYASIHFPTYDVDWDSEAYATVSGQNSNNSVRVTDAFLRAVREDAPWELLRRTDGLVAKTIRARELWEQVGHAAWACADPGIQYHDTVNAWHTCPEDGEIRGSNPCSEYMFLDDTACNLASVNLLTFWRDGAFDADRYVQAARLWTLTLEISVLMAQFPSKEIAQRSYDFRTLGLGYANIGGLLMTMGHGYDSHEGRALCGALTALLTGTSYATSAEMASEVGAFPGHARNAEPMLRVIRNHRRAAHGEAEGYEGLAVPPVPLDAARCPDARLVEMAASAWGRGAAARGGARLPQRAGHRDRAHRHDRARDGLRHHRHRARLRAGEVQEARGRRLLQDHQPLGPRGAARPGLRRRAGGRDRRLRRGPRHAEGRADRHPRGAGRARLRAGGDREGRGGAAVCLRHPLRLQPVDAGRGVLHRDAGRAEGAARRSVLRPPAPSRLHPPRDRGRRRLRVWDHDVGGRASPEGRASDRVRLRQRLRSQGPPVPVGGLPHPHDGGRAVLHLGRDLQDHQHAARRHDRGLPGGLRAVVVAGREGQRALPRRLQALPAARLRARRGR